jgi:hypothetical protein
MEAIQFTHETRFKTLVISDSRRSQSLTDEKSEKVCEECETRLSTIFCRDCQVVYCHECSQDIHSRRVFRDHKVVPLMEVEQGLSKVTRVCHHHCRQFYCQDCVVTLCSVCLIHDHKSHNFELSQDASIAILHRVRAQIRVEGDKQKRIQQLLRRFEAERIVLENALSAPTFSNLGEEPSMAELRQSSIHSKFRLNLISESSEILGLFSSHIHQLHQGLNFFHQRLLQQYQSKLTSQHSLLQAKSDTLCSIIDEYHDIESQLQINDSSSLNEGMTCDRYLELSKKLETFASGWDISESVPQEETIVTVDLKSIQLSMQNLNSVYLEEIFA